jgi:long-chain acyl-CoA synthetase
MSELPSPAQQLLQRAAATPNEPYLHQPHQGQWRQYTWAEVADQTRRMAAALQSLGLPPGSRIGITGVNTAHWFMAEFACQFGGFVSVGLYPKQSEDAVSYIANHSEMKAVFVGPMPDAASMLGALPKDLVRISLPYPGVDKTEHAWDDLVARHKPLAKPAERGPDDLLTLIYTSGTTGNPKGVMMTTRNFQFAIGGMMREMPARPSGEFLLSYLPLAHAFERGAVLASSIYIGAQVYFLESLDKLAQTLQYVRPTRFYGVPLVWTRMQSEILKKLPQKKLDKLMRIPILSGIVKRKLRQGLGFERCWLRVSGAAPMPMPVLQWFQRVGLDIFQGYGMTENSIYVSCNMPGKNRLGSVGIPFQDSLIRIAPDGEIQNKHPAVTPGYFRAPDKTAELYTQDGWLRTGDVGRLDANGYLYVTGRVKEIFKTLKGKYVTPAPIEGAFLRNTDIDQLCLVGAGLRQPIMLVSLNVDAQKKARDAVEGELVTTMNQVNESLEDHEKIAKIIVTRDSWTIDNSLMTPTMKVRRNEVEKRFGDIIQKNENNRDKKLIWE